MSNQILVAYFFPKRLIGELLVSALRLLGIEATSFEDPSFTVPLRPADAPSIIILIAPSSLEDTARVIRTFRYSGHDFRIVVVIADETDGNTNVLLEAGANACVSASDSFQRVVATIESVQLMQGKDSSAVKIFERLSALTTSALNLHERAELTLREKEVLQLLASGLSNKQIGYQLSISISTVKNHVHNILSKLQLSRRRETLLWRLPRIPAHSASTSYEHKRSAG